MLVVFVYQFWPVLYIAFYEPFIVWNFGLMEREKNALLLLFFVGVPFYCVITQSTVFPFSQYQMYAKTSRRHGKGYAEVEVIKIYDPKTNLERALPYRHCSGTNLFLYNKVNTMFRSFAEREPSLEGASQKYLLAAKNLVARSGRCEWALSQYFRLYRLKWNFTDLRPGEFPATEKTLLGELRP